LFRIGATLHQALENGVSQYPKLEGRFLQVAGIRFAFDPSKPAGQRIDPRLIMVQEEYLDLNKEYKLATKAYLKQGKDGFDCLVNTRVLVTYFSLTSKITIKKLSKLKIDSEDIPVLYNLVENHFQTINKLKSTKRRHRFRSSIVPLFIVNKLLQSLSSNPDVINQNANQPKSPSTHPFPKLNFHNAAFIVTRMLSFKDRVLSKQERRIIRQSELFKKQIEEYESESIKLAPRVEGRITCIRDEAHYQELLKEREQVMKLAQNPIFQFDNF
jgi:5'-nucleotidase